MGLRLGIDIDGVLADFRTAFKDTARECLRRDVLVESGDDKATVDPVDIERVWNHIARTRNWWMGVRAYDPPAVAQLDGVAGSGRGRVVFLTKGPASAGDKVQFQTQW